MAKFENVSKYYGWSDVDRYHHLCASLEGAAGQVVWDAGQDATVDVILALLRTRFGNELLAERYKAELRARKRKAGESLQVLYQDIIWLVSWPFREVRESCLVM